MELISQPKAPAIHTLPKSRYSPIEEANAVKQACHAAIGNHFPTPIYYGRKKLGYTWGDREKPVSYYCAVTSYDSIINAISTNGNKHLRHWQKFVSSTPAAFWVDLWSTEGTPGQGSYSGSAFTARSLTYLDAGCLNITNVSTSTRYMTTLGAGWITPTSVSTLLMYDRVLTYEACTWQTSSKNMTNTATAARYNGAGLSGMQIMLTAQTTTGATTSNLTEVTYTNQGGTGSHTMPTTPTVRIGVSAAADTGFTGQRVVAPCITSGTSTPVALFLFLQNSDIGVRSIQSYTMSASNSGTLCFALVRPIAYMPICLSGVATVSAGYSVLDMVQQVQNLEQIYDGAHLSFACASTSAVAGTSGLFGHFETIWI